MTNQIVSTTFAGNRPEISAFTLLNYYTQNISRWVVLAYNESPSQALCIALNPSTTKFCRTFPNDLSEMTGVHLIEMINTWVRNKRWSQDFYNRICCVHCTSCPLRYGQCDWDSRTRYFPRVVLWSGSYTLRTLPPLCSNLHFWAWCNAYVAKFWSHCRFGALWERR